MTSECIDDLDACALVDGALEAARVAAVVEHADACRPCRDLIEELCAAQTVTPARIEAPRDALIGTELAGMFQIRELIATGGMGHVYRAYEPAIARDVAIKVPRTRSPWLVRRFVREVAITARLVHPGIVPVHAAGRLPDGRPFYVMPIIEGTPLEIALSRTANREQRLALLHHVVAVANTMAFAHDAGIAHRDLKPQNVLIGRHGETLVIDWGLAKDLDASVPLRSVPAVASAPGASIAVEITGRTTRPGDVIGTPAFMAPEQARGEEVDERSDVYAVGAMLEHLLTGRLPRKAADAALALAPPELVAICRTAMAANRDERYPNCGALAAALHTAARLRPAEPATVSRHRARPLAVAALASVCVALAAYAAYGGLG